MKKQPNAAPTIIPEVEALPDWLDGTRSIAEMVPAPCRGGDLGLGKQAIKDVGARYRQIVGLKPGGSSIRTVEMIDELIQRLLLGESATSISCDTHMPALSTLWYWCRADPKLDSEIKWAQTLGQRLLIDITQDIAAGGTFSTGDARRDELLVKTITANAAKRNRKEFGDRVQVDHATVTVMLPDRTSDL